MANDTLEPIDESTKPNLGNVASTNGMLIQRINRYLDAFVPEYEKLTDHLVALITATGKVTLTLFGKRFERILIISVLSVAMILLGHFGYLDPLFVILKNLRTYWSMARLIV